MSTTRFFFLVPLLVTLVLAYASLVTGVLNPIDKMYYDIAKQKYEDAHNVWPMTRVKSFKADPQREWRDGAMRERWIERAQRDGVIKIGSYSNPLNFGRKVTYFSTPIQSRGAGDQLAREMMLENNRMDYEALIFWRHENGVSKPLKIDYVRNLGANYQLTPFNEVLGKGASRIRPI